jgi:solute carrier family 6 amino acid/orphan transporter-like 15/16/17/18/20
MTYPDVSNGRDRWRNRFFFVTATVGSSIGLGNIWKFGYLVFKHGGFAFIFTYLGFLIIVGIPMMILELTLGQKMQRGSVGCLRGITPRLVGAGWAGAFSGFITGVVYCILLGLCLVYLFNSGTQPWSDKNYTRAIGCDTSVTNQISNTELYLYQNVTKVLGENSCQRYTYLTGENTFASNLFGCVVLTFVIVFLILSRGVKTL